MRTVERLRGEQGLPAADGAHALPSPRPPGSPLRWGASVVGAVVGLALAFAPGENAPEPNRYDEPPRFTPGEGTYAFLNSQPTSTDPVGFNPCRPIRYVVNPTDAPPDWRELIGDAVAHVEWATGLDWVDAGTTTLRPFSPGQLDGALGETPVVIGFADEGEIPQLAGRVAGIGGGNRPSQPMGRTYYDGGSVALDTEIFDGPSSGAERYGLQGVVDHELGHVVGLAHVEDPGELMAAAGDSRYDFGPGDLEGLSILGSIPCQ